MQKLGNLVQRYVYLSSKVPGNPEAYSRSAAQIFILKLPPADQEASRSARSWWNKWGQNSYTIDIWRSNYLVQNLAPELPISLGKLFWYNRGSCTPSPAGEWNTPSVMLERDETLMIRFWMTVFPMKWRESLDKLRDMWSYSHIGNKKRIDKFDLKIIESRYFYCQSGYWNKIKALHTRFLECT